MLSYVFYGKGPTMQDEMRGRRMKKNGLKVFIAAVLLGASCTTPRQDVTVDPLSKVEFTLVHLDTDGLRGPADGKVDMSYEFAIPKTQDCIAEVRAIDPTVQIMCGSPGRIGAGENECLCIGSTHQPNYREVIENLAKLPYMKRMIQCHFE